MLFSSAIFLFLFLPVVLAGYYLLRGSWRNGFLLIASLLFFAWGGVGYSLLLLGSILINYLAGLLIYRNLGQFRSKTYLSGGVAANLLLLGIFKYAGFIGTNINAILEVLSIPPMPLPHILLPIGISFYTFQSISYLVDVYRGETHVQKNLLRLGLYISLFPQLIAGPIVRYHEMDKQLASRTTNLSKFSDGIRRFVLGLAKKVMLANSFGIIADEIFVMDPLTLSPAMAWLGLLVYGFQIYYDFSGYSDMAIGLGSMLGFRIPENFNFPYTARSVREFWRRWHISLSTWFRDYLYIPLGGNRFGNYRTYLNLLLVFFLTGLWHGANWTFILWGLIHGFFMVIERLGFEKFLNRLWRPLQHAYVLLAVFLAWVVFRADNLEIARNYYLALAGLTEPRVGYYELSKYLNPEFYVLLIIALAGALYVFRWVEEFFDKIEKDIQPRLVLVGANLKGSLMVLFYMGLFVLCVVYLIAETYNPFIYFRF